MEIQQDLAIRGESVERIYDYYLSENFLVNRRYQRKLVWTIEEKQGFVDSIRQGFPIPLILVAEVIYKDKTRYEIIDGMQRLNAIVSFIEGEFSLDGKYFDLNTMAKSKLLLDKGDLSQKTPVLDREICTKVASYTFPLSVYKVESESKIDEIFRRINANGRHLSQQELRHVGVTGLFPEVVRRISSKIRGDSSHSDKLILNSMKNISINNKNLSYGIKIQDIFWVENNIITYSNVRDSRDEELIAHLLAYMLLGNNPPPPPTAKALDTFYGFDSSTRYDDENAQQISSFNEIEDAVKKIGPKILERQFLAVYEEIKNVLNASGKSNFPSLIFRRKWFSIHRHFQVIFLVFYELLVKENMKIDDYKNVAGKLDGIGDKNMTIKSTGGFWNAESRQDNLNAVIGVIKDKFTKRLGNDPALDCWKTQLQNLLMQSYTEQAQYDFKIGLHRLDDKGAFDEDLLHKVFRTLTAMANHGLDNVGYVIIGIADKETDAERLRPFMVLSRLIMKNFILQEWTKKQTSTIRV